MKNSAVAILCMTLLGSALAAGEPAITEYRGICDASAAIALDENLFAVADDEHNVLKIYRRGQAKEVSSVSVIDSLGNDESDLEGAAKIGNRIFWIASHGRNAKGKLREQRHRFFATDIVGQGDSVTLKVVGTPYTRLLDDLLADTDLKPFKLDVASSLAAEAKDGLNIEGLAATPDGQLLIGFRNPIIKGKALIVPLENPQEMIEGKKARLGTPIALDLQKRGIRSIERVKGSYLIVAGPPAKKGTFALFKWSGKPSDAPEPVRSVGFDGLSPEALFEIPDKETIQVLSDDGERKFGDRECKEIEDADFRLFRSLSIQIP